MDNIKKQKEILKLIHANHSDPFSFLGPHIENGELIIRYFNPNIKAANVITFKNHGVIDQEVPMRLINTAGIFEVNMGGRLLNTKYKIKAVYENYNSIKEDIYRFKPVIGELDEYYFNEGNHIKIYEKLGCHFIEQDGIKGISFTVWAPNAKRVSLVGSFNNWDGKITPMRLHPKSGLWDIFIPNLSENVEYKYEIKTQNNELLPLKIDPYAFKSELRPNTATLTFDMNIITKKKNKSWIEKRSKINHYEEPISIYEVHLPSWKRSPDDPEKFLNIKELTDDLINYVKYMNFTHIELLPINEHPLDQSWGYQPTGMYAPTSRLGTPEDYKYFIQKAHEAEIGVFIDWVPAHFPKDEFGLAYFDGTPLYEYEDPRKGEHPDWGTKVYDYGKNEVINYLIGSALFWLKEYEIDGIRADAVSSMVYLDYSRGEGEWEANDEGGRVNKEGVKFLQKMNELAYQEAPGCTTIAEESTDFSGVSRPVYAGGLGFGYKWNMGWMNDVLKYFTTDPLYRTYHHNLINFSFHYIYNENFILPLSHDEVVHGKKSLLEKMPGDEWQKFANLRCLYGFMWAHPGKKLLFMGGEFAQKNEWNSQQSLDWHLTDVPSHKQIQNLTRDLNIIYKNQLALYQLDTQEGGFDMINWNDYINSTISFIRYSKNKDEFVIIVSNLTPQVRENFRIGVPKPGYYQEIFNSDSIKYGGSGIENFSIESQKHEYYKFKDSIQITLPPLATIYLKIK